MGTTGVHAPVVSTYSHGVVAAPAVSSVVSPVVRTVASPVVSHVAAPVVRTVASPVVSHVATPAVYSGYHAGVYSGLSSVYGHYYGKREAEAEPEAYTIGQVHAGLPLVNAYATGHPHNVGYTTNVGYTHYPYAHYGYGYTGHYYGQVSRRPKTKTNRTKRCSLVEKTSCLVELCNTRNESNKRMRMLIKKKKKKKKKKIPRGETPA